MLRRSFCAHHSTETEGVASLDRCGSTSQESARWLSSRSIVTPKLFLARRRSLGGETQGLRGCRVTAGLAELRYARDHLQHKRRCRLGKGRGTPSLFTSFPYRPTPTGTACFKRSHPPDAAEEVLEDKLFGSWEQTSPRLRAEQRAFLTQNREGPRSTRACRSMM
jgi:hypothetical protein